MGTLLQRGLHRAAAFFAIVLFVWFSSPAFAFPVHELTRGQWSLISLPADPGSEGTVENLFADDLPLDQYGPGGGWYMFSYDAAAGEYSGIALDTPLAANSGYWIVQTIADSVTLDLPDSLSPVVGDSVTGCLAGQLCTTVSLASSDNAKSWNLIGFSSEAQTVFGDSRFVSGNLSCSTGCTPAEALVAGVSDDVLFQYNPDNQDSPYERVTEATALQSWNGYWFAVRPDAESLEWVVPVGVDPREDASGPPGSTLPSAERDAARLLMQASFGPTTESIQEVLTAGGPAAWVDAQLALPATLHLPQVKALSPPDENDEQESRYTTFWDRAINSRDQLRQRVAYSLSEIMVVSDKSDVVKDHSNLSAAYYDVLLNGAFGNFRDLLEDVTLNPAMGVFLSMLGNAKPDEETGKRADENYAREMMQLFSIGLVGLNPDGTEREGIITYEQTDVEALARVLTGWSWNVGEWRTNSRYGWEPDRTTLEIPMVAFEEHHDTDAKQFLGMTIPAGQSAEVDLQMALDRIFTHPNVGPFIGKQLIKRLVTSNPSPGYVARVASAFNDNGSGVRGDLSTVVRAILLDQEARGLESSEHPEFGKLRESLLRYSHMLRAFRVTDTLEIKRWQINQLPQLAPLTAPSVFNFFSPGYTPPGAIANANLVAPEFQLNSETNLNKVNKTIMRTLLRDEFLRTDVTVNLDRELSLLGTPEALISHLDLMLTAETLSDGSRELLAEYIKMNKGEIEDLRLVQDVVALVVSSTEFAIQR